MDETRSKELNNEQKKQLIRRDIDVTLEEMGTTLDEIKNRLSPDELKHQAKDRLDEMKHQTKDRLKSTAKTKARNMKSSMEHTMKEYKSTMSDTVRDNPLPAAVAGIGIGWLVFSMYKERKDRKRGMHYPHECYTFYNAWTGEFEEACPEEACLEEEGGMTGQYREKGSEKAEEFKGRLKERSEHFRQQMSGRTGELKHRASDWGHQASQRTTQARQGFQRQMRSNPMPIGMAAIAAGALIGLLVPESTWEDRVMGEQRDEMMHRAKETGREKMEQAKHAAEESKETFKKEMKKEHKKEEAPV